MIYSVDPEGSSPCWAAWRDRYLYDLGEDAFKLLPEPDDFLVIENQVIIPRFTRKPAAIIDLAHSAACIARDFGWPDPARVRWVAPRTWKGGTRKPKTARAWASYAIHRLVVQALSAGELSLYTVALADMPEGARHDMADAVAIGLWHLDRLPRPNTEAA